MLLQLLLPLRPYLMSDDPSWTKLGVLQATSYKLQVTSYSLGELQPDLTSYNSHVSSYKSQASSCTLQVKSHKSEVELGRKAQIRTSKLEVTGFAGDTFSWRMMADVS